MNGFQDGATVRFTGPDDESRLEVSHVDSVDDHTLDATLTAEPDGAGHDTTWP